ncbi:MAG: hypothetical protein ABL925_01885 [Methylococcales bacterium]
METYLPIIKNTLDQLYQTTVDNYIYAAILVVLTWFVTAVFYSIRIAILRRRNRKTEQARLEIQGSLESSQQQLQQNQDELANTVAQMQQEQATAQKQTERLNTVEGLIFQRNKQLGDLIQTLATQMDLGERPIPVSEDIKADEVWQQHDRVSKQLLERLRTEQQSKVELQLAVQAESAKVAEKEVLLNTLKTTLDLQTSQLANLEVALAEQKNLLQQQQYQAQQVLLETREKHRAELAQVAPSYQPAAQPSPVVQPAVVSAEPTSELTFLSPQEHYQPAKALDEAMQVVQSVVGNLQDTVAMPDLSAPVAAAPQSAPAAAIEQAAELAKASVLEQDYLELGLADLIKPQVDNKPVAKNTEGVAGKLKGLFTKKTPNKDKAEAKQAAKKPSEATAKPAGTGKLTGWLGKLTSKNK